MTLRKIFTVGTFAVLSLALAHCDGSGTSGNNVDQGSTQDMAMPPPVITSVAPGAVSNGGGVSITITGTGFQTGATVTVAGVACANPVVTATTITCTTGATTSPVCGPTAIVVTNPDQQTTSNNTALQLKSKSLGFGNPSNIANVANDPNSKSAATADLNGDGNMDVVNLDEVAGGAGVVPKLSIHLGKGDGTFLATTVVNLPATSNPTSLAVGDITGDNKLDVVIAYGGTDQVQVFSGDGQGGFTGQTAVNVAAKNPLSIALGDINADGKLDAVIGHLAGNGLTTLTNTSGVLGGGTSINLGGMTITQISSVAVADVNADSKPDVVVTGANSNNIAVFLGQGAAKFGTPTVFNMPGGPARLVLTDFNNDKKLDVATANAGAGTVSIRLGDALGGFGGTTPFTSIAAGMNSIALSAGDFDLDGNIDLVVANSTGSNFTALTGKGDGTLNAGKTFGTNAGPSSIVSADYNRDGSLDVVTTSSTPNLAINLNVCQ